MSDSTLSSTIPGYVHEIESLRQEILELIAEKQLLLKDHDAYQTIIKKLKEDNQQLADTLEKIKSHTGDYEETEPEEFKRLWREKLAEEITYLRGIVENFSKGGGNG